MTDEHTPFPVEYDEELKCWKVKSKNFDSESDANLISNIPCLMDELEELKSKDKPYDDSLIQRLRKTAVLIKNKGFNFWVSRKIEAVYKDIQQNHD